MASQSISSSHDAVDTAEIVISDKDSFQVRHQPGGIDWRWFASLTALLFVTALLSSILIFGGSLSRLAHQNNQLAACRARMSLLVTDAEIKADIFEYELFSSLSEGTEEQIAADVRELSRLSDELREALDRRIEFETELALPCPVPEGELYKEESTP